MAQVVVIAIVTISVGCSSSPSSPSASSPSGAGALPAIGSLLWDQVVGRTLRCEPPAQPDAWPVVQANPAAGVQVQVVLAACVAGASTPPEAVYVYDDGATPQVRLRQVLLGLDADEILSDVHPWGPVLLAQADFYLHSRLRCCPDGHRVHRWVWSNGRYVNR